jgi:hypothetical protein
VAIYSNIYVVLNGSVLAEAVSVETSLERATAEVFSVANGFEGVTTGPLVRRITVSNVVPLDVGVYAAFNAGRSGEMYPEYESMMANNDEVEIMLQEGHAGRRLITRGFITSVSRSGAVGQTTTLSFVFVGNGASAFE